MFGDEVAVSWPELHRETRSPGGEARRFRRIRTSASASGALAAGLAVGRQCLAGPAGFAGWAGLAGCAGFAGWAGWAGLAGCAGLCRLAACALWVLCVACALWVL